MRNLEKEGILKNPRESNRILKNLVRESTIHSSTSSFKTLSVRVLCWDNFPQQRSPLKGSSGVKKGPTDLPTWIRQLCPRVPDFGSRRPVLSETLISDEMLLWLESRAEDGTWNPKGSPRDPEGGFHESIVFIRFGSVQGPRVAKSKSIIRTDR